MNRERRAGTAAGVLFVCAFAAAGAHAQSASDGRWEAGGFVGAIDFRERFAKSRSRSASGSAIASPTISRSKPS
jgi:hypothetical protein